jgi:hypothetical protein
VVHACNLSTLGDKAGRSRVQSKPGIHREKLKTKQKTDSDILSSCFSVHFSHLYLPNLFLTFIILSYFSQRKTLKVAVLETYKVMDNVLYFYLNNSS